MKVSTMNFSSFHIIRCFTYKLFLHKTNKKQFNTIDELFHSYPRKTPSKFIPLAKRYGFKEQQAKQHLATIIHNIKVPKAKYIPIISKHPNGFQIDTFINRKQKGGLNYLMFININARKAYSFQMRGKSSNEVLNAFQQFIKDVPNVYSLTSDQDVAYLTNDALESINSHSIKYQTTEDNNHNVLGIINKFMRTIRDLIGQNRYKDEDEMSNLIDTYNNPPHSSLDNKTPNDITEQTKLYSN